MTKLLLVYVVGVGEDMTMGLIEAAVMIGSIQCIYIGKGILAVERRGATKLLAAGCIMGFYQ